MNYQQQVDAAIQAAAAKRWGSLPVSVIKLDESRRNPDSSGEWFCLFIGGECLGRRRTRAELLAMVQQQANAYAAI